MSRLDWVLSFGIVAAGCYQSHLADEGVRCGDEICREWEHCCVTCAEARCFSVDLPCPFEDCDGCWSSADCDTGRFCDSPTCDGYGTCVPIPEGCTADCPGVCGCDGLDYCNACEAARAGVSVSHEGACGGELCGGEVCAVDMICCPLCFGDGFCAGAFDACPDVDCFDESCTRDDECPAGDWCDFPDDSCGGLGVCRPRPRGCDDDCPGVCGCDGRRYCNDCNAAGAGTDVGPASACEGMCGRGGRVCDPDEYCDLGLDCGATDLVACRERPMTCPDIFEPVCGCDGVTYGNACLANANGVTVGDVGACEDG